MTSSALDQVKHAWSISPRRALYGAEVFEGHGVRAGERRRLAGAHAAAELLEGAGEVSGIAQRGVSTRYESFLREIGREEADDLHQHVVDSMISGSLAQLTDWLNQRHGPAAFVTIFKSPACCARYQSEGPKRSAA